ncbi:phage protein GemA/Gp16 family protein, partial [Salinisphaera orenii]|uniref:phage protein GemA/Gp16 family protein n=1 Tax=Salinisphaera orenii TaxID=856731 RepID=UPI000DBE1E60
KKELALDDAAYREMLWTVARVRSAADLDGYGRRAVLDHLKSRGWQPRGGRGGQRPANADREPMLTKIEALLADQNLPWTYADRLAKQMYGVERVAWLRDTDQLAGLITALTKRAEAADG